jgi:hypothetical protein
MRTEVYFTLREGELRISRDEPPFEWEGRPDGLSVLEARVTADGRAAVVLLDAPAGTGHVRNLVRIEADAQISWRGELPDVEPTDSFVDFEFVLGGDIAAATWSGYSVLLSGHNGQLLRKHFTK